MNPEVIGAYMLDLFINPKFVVFFGIFIFLYIGAIYVCLRKRNPIKIAVLSGLFASLFVIVPLLILFGKMASSSGKDAFGLVIVAGLMMGKLPHVFLIAFSSALLISFFKERIKRKKEIFFIGKKNILIVLAFLVLTLFLYRISVYAFNRKIQLQIKNSISSEELGKIYNSKLSFLYVDGVMYEFASNSYTPESILELLKNHKNRSVRREVFENPIFDYDHFAVQFLSEMKGATVLGKLPRPLRILRKDNQFYAFHNKENAAVEIPINRLLEIDSQKDVFFDIYTDRFFYVKDGIIHYYDLPERKNYRLEGEFNIRINEAICDIFDCNSHWQIAGVYGDYINLEGVSYAASGQMATYDLKTGEKQADLLFAGYDASKAYEFWIDEQGYRLIVNSKGEMEAGLSPKGPNYTRYSQSQDNIAKFYLEKINQSFSESLRAHEEDHIEKWGGLVFTGGKSSYLEDRKFIALLESNSQRENGKFSIRNFYQLDNAHVALEINEKLAVIDLQNSSVEFLEDENEIFTILGKAMLLAADSLEYRHDAYCAFDDFISDLARSKDYEFIFCLM